MGSHCIHGQAVIPSCRTNINEEQFGADKLNHVQYVLRTFLRRHIRQYLQQHAHLPPKTVVLVALLSPSKQATVRPAAQESSSGAAQRLSRSAEAAGGTPSLSL